MILDVDRGKTNITVLTYAYKLNKWKNNVTYDRYPTDKWITVVLFSVQSLLWHSLVERVVQLGKLDDR